MKIKGKQETKLNTTKELVQTIRTEGPVSIHSHFLAYFVFSCSYSGGGRRWHVTVGSEVLNVLDSDNTKRTMSIKLDL